MPNLPWSVTLYVLSRAFGVRENLRVFQEDGLFGYYWVNHVGKFWCRCSAKGPYLTLVGHWVNCFGIHIQSKRGEKVGAAKNSPFKSFDGFAGLGAPLFIVLDRKLKHGDSDLIPDDVIHHAVHYNAGTPLHWVSLNRKATQWIL